MTASLFAGYVALVAAVVVAIARRYLPPRTGRLVTVALPFWLLYVGIVGLSGLLEPMAGRPPGILLVFVPVVLFVALVLVRSRAGLAAALAIPIPLLLILQVFRGGVELLLHRLWLEGLVPRMLTYEGANPDMLVALSAPIAAWLSTRGSLGLRLALAWNLAGLLVLANVVFRSVLTAPGPLQFLPTEVPNLAPNLFPYVFLPGFLPALGVSLHVLAIRAILHRLRAAGEGGWRAASGASA